MVKLSLPCLSQIIDSTTFLSGDRIVFTTPLYTIHQTRLWITHCVLPKLVLIVLCVLCGCCFDPPGEYEEV